MESYAVHFAPLQGYTDSVYREAHARVFGGVETYYTPFVRLEKSGFRNKELRDLAPEANTSASLVPQMIAASPEEFRRIAGLFRESGYRRRYQFRLFFPDAGTTTPGSGYPALSG